MMKTKKLYYEDTFFSECVSRVQEVATQGIRLDQTVAFPEGGGQKGDSGVMIVGNDSEELTIPFHDTQKGPGRVVYLDDFPTIQVDNPIYHVVLREYSEKVKVGDTVRVRTNVEKRARITISHTGIHLVLTGVEEIFPSMSQSIKGASITDEYARLDFRKQDRFNAGDLKKISDFVNAMVDDDAPVLVFPHDNEPEAWYWQCKGKTYPCGGTHVKSTKCVGRVQLRRKNLGKGLERLVATFPSAKLPLEQYKAAF